MIILFIFQVLHDINSSNKIILINKFDLSLIFFLVILPYHKLFKYFQKIIIFLNLIVIISTTFLYRYLKIKIKITENNSIKKAYYNNNINIYKKRIFFYLDFLNLISLLHTNNLNFFKLLSLCVIDNVLFSVIIEIILLLITLYVVYRA